MKSLAKRILAANRAEADGFLNSVKKIAREVAEDDLVEALNVVFDKTRMQQNVTEGNIEAVRKILLAEFTKAINDYVDEIPQ